MHPGESRYFDFSRYRPFVNYGYPRNFRYALFLKGSAMSANISKRLQILFAEERISKKCGNKYQVAQCVVYDRDGIPKVGELWSFNKELTLVAGEFVAEFEISVDMDRKVSAQLVALHPITKTGVVSSSASAASVPVKA